MRDDLQHQVVLAPIVSSAACSLFAILLGAFIDSCKAVAHEGWGRDSRAPREKRALQTGRETAKDDGSGVGGKRDG